MSLRLPEPCSLPAHMHARVQRLMNVQDRAHRPATLKEAWLDMNVACDWWLQPGPRKERDERYGHFCRARQAFKRLLVAERTRCAA